MQPQNHPQKPKGFTRHHYGTPPMFYPSDGSYNHAGGVNSGGGGVSRPPQAGIPFHHLQQPNQNNSSVAVVVSQMRGPPGGQQQPQQQQGASQQGQLVPHSQQQMIVHHINSGHQSIPTMSSVSSVGGSNSATSVVNQNAPTVAPPNASPAPGHEQSQQQQGGMSSGVMSGPMPQQQQPGGPGLQGQMYSNGPPVQTPQGQIYQGFPNHPVVAGANHQRSVQPGTILRTDIPGMQPVFMAGNPQFGLYNLHAHPHHNSQYSMQPQAPRNVTAHAGNFHHPPALHAAYMGYQPQGGNIFYAPSTPKPVQPTQPVQAKPREKKLIHIQDPETLENIDIHSFAGDKKNKEAQSEASQETGSSASSTANPQDESIAADFAARAVGANNSSGVNSSSSLVEVAVVENPAPIDESSTSQSDGVDGSVPPPLVQSQEMTLPPTQQHQMSPMPEAQVQHIPFNTPPPNYKMTPPPANVSQATLVMGPPPVQMMPPHSKGSLPAVNMAVPPQMSAGVKVSTRAMPGAMHPQYQPTQAQMIPNPNVPIFQSPPPLGPSSSAHDVHQPPPAAAISTSGLYDPHMKQQQQQAPPLQQHQPIRSSASKPLLETPPPSIAQIQQVPVAVPINSMPMVSPVEHLKEQSPGPIVVDTSTPPPSVPIGAAPHITPPQSAVASKQPSLEPEIPKGKKSRVQAENHVTNEPSSSSVTPPVKSSDEGNAPVLVGAAAVAPVQVQSTAAPPPETNGVVTTPDQQPVETQQPVTPKVPEISTPKDTLEETKVEPDQSKSADPVEPACTKEDSEIETNSENVQEPSKSSEQAVEDPANNVDSTKTEEKPKQSEDVPETTQKDASSRESSEPPTTLPKYNYREGNWNPLNPAGVKAYDRRLLLELKEASLSQIKPKDLPDLDIIKNEPVQMRTYDKSSSSRMGNMGVSDFTPGYMMTGASGRNKGYMPVYRGQNNSMQGRKKPPKIIEAKPSTSKATLKTVENAWIALSKKADGNLDKLTICKTKLIGMLNKLCPDNYDKIKEQFKELIIEYPMFFPEIIQQLFDKAITEQHFSPVYAKLCKSVTENNKNDKDDPIVKIVASFKRMLLVKCQMEFERTHKFGGYYTNKEASEKRIKNCKDEEEKKRLQEEHDKKFIDEYTLKKVQLEIVIKKTSDETKLRDIQEELEYLDNQTRKRSVGLIKFVGELYKESMLTPKIMLGLVSMFGNVVHDNHAAEAFCKLFTTIGERLYTSIDDSNKNTIRDSIDKCRRQTQTGAIQTRTKFLLLDIIELFDNNFVAKHRSQKQVEASTKQEVHQKMIQEEMDDRNAIDNSRRVDNRRGGGNRGSMSRENYHSENSEVWKTVVNSSSSSKKNSLRNFNARQSDNGGDPPRLGPGAGYAAWSFGASGGSKDVPKPNSGNNEQRQGNRYDVLQDDDMSGADYNNFKRSSQKGYGSLINRNYPFKNSSGNGQEMMQHNSFGDHRSGDRSNSMNRRSNMPPSGGDARNKSLNREQQINASGGRGFYQTPGKKIAPPKPAATEEIAKEKPINMDDIRRKAIGTVEEYYINKILKDAELDIEEKFSKKEEYMFFLKIVILDVFEKKASDRESLACLIKYILSNRIIALDVVKEGLKLCATELPDLVLDVPQVNDYFITLLAPSIIGEQLSIADFWEVIEKTDYQRVQVFIKLLRKLASSIQTHEFMKLWAKSGLKLEDLLGEHLSRTKQTVASFLEEEKLEFLNAETHDQRTEAYFKCFESQVDQLKDPKALRETVRNIVKGFVKADVNGKDKVSISTEDYDALFERLGALKDVMEKNKIEGRDIELAVLFAMQSIAVDHKVPPGLLESLFNMVYDSDLASKESFQAWENSSSDENEQFQGMCVTSVRSFLRDVVANN